MKQHSHAKEMAAYRAKLADIVKRHGWAVQHVMTTPPLSYTVGLHAKGLPELVSVGLEGSTAQTVLNQVARRLIEGELTLVEGKDYDTIFNGFMARFRQVPSVQVHRSLKVAMSMANGETPIAWQLTFPDPSGKFEGEPGFEGRFGPMQSIELAMGPTDLDS